MGDMGDDSGEIDNEPGILSSDPEAADEWAQRAIQARSFEVLETALSGLPGGDDISTEDLKALATRMHGRAVNRVHHCLEHELQPEAWVLNAAVSFGSLRTRVNQLRFLPASGLTGENVSKRDPKGALAKWYDGPTLLEAIDSFSAAPRATEKTFRMCVSDVTPGGKGVSVTGRIVQGRVRAGDKLIVMPLEDQSAVVRLERNGEQTRAARAGDNAELFLSGIDPSRVVTGNVLCKAGEAPRVPVRRRFNAQIITLQALEVPIVKGTEFQLHMHNIDVIAHCSKLISLNNNAGEVLRERPRCIPSGSTAHIRITSSRAICVEKYGDCRSLGRFVLRQQGVTVALGLVLETDLR